MWFCGKQLFLLKDEVQAYHKSNAQAILHIFSTCFRSKDETEIHVSYIVISVYLSHNTAAMQLLRKHY